MTVALKLIELSRTKRWPEHRIISACVRVASIIAGAFAAHDIASASRGTLKPS